ncbi:MAG: hypothetical protein HXY24_12010 [Rubrivivax sp.]|nr:hypothetical protein [Rubrivivax sp.]
MHELEPLSCPPAADRPRHAHQEVVDLLAAALLRLRGQHQPPSDSSIAADSNAVGLGFVGQERVNANPDQDNGVRP